MLPMWGKAQIKREGEPYIYHHTRTNIAANSQNWDIIKDKQGVMYFANTGGILSFDGSNWGFMKTETGAAVKSLAIDTTENKIYVGVNGDLGVLVNVSLRVQKSQILAARRRQ